MDLTPDDPSYPERLHDLFAPPTLRVSAPVERHSHAVAIVGSRRPSPEAVEYAHALAFDLARAGVLVVSGGAIGIDAAAHHGALQGGGSTWLVCPHGLARQPSNRQAREVLGAVRSEHRARIVSLFSDEQPQDSRTPLARNKLIVSLVDAVVVVQAWKRSGSMNAISACRRHERPFEPWVVPGLPWDDQFHGSLLAIEEGARPLTSPLRLFRELGLPAPSRLRSLLALPAEELRALDRTVRETARESSSVKKGTGRNRPPNSPLLDRIFEGWTEDEKLVYSCISMTPNHVDGISGRAGMNVGATVTALLTLVLKDVVVEGPDGFFRRSPT